MKTHLKMLVVDDNADLRVNLAQQFVAEDFDVDTAVDGLDAVAKVKAGNYDIILLDLKMPGLDGMEVLKEIKALNKNPHVIMLTAVADVATAQECVKLGARDYVSKPYDPEDLLHIVIKVLGS
jgi:DNA-binding response OmpR family regulator